jgi:hypothetical protein
MIRKENLNAALRALNTVLVVARKMAYDHASYESLASALDSAEYLPVLMLDKDDQTDAFRALLQDLAHKHPRFQLAVDAFDVEEG